MFALLYTSSAVVWKCGSDTWTAAGCWAGGTEISQGTANVFRLYRCWGRITKSPCLILAHLSLFSLASTMSSAPRRIIGLHCRRQTIYWHFASVNNAVCLPAPIHFTVRTIRHNTTQQNTQTCTHTLFVQAPTSYMRTMHTATHREFTYHRRKYMCTVQRPQKYIQKHNKMMCLCCQRAVSEFYSVGSSLKRLSFKVKWILYPKMKILIIYLIIY